MLVTKDTSIRRSSLMAASWVAALSTRSSWAGMGRRTAWMPTLLPEELLRDELLPLTRTPAIFADV